MSEEPDPTGVRDLLAGMRDPGPMPDELAERIRSRLADEQEDRTGSGAITPLRPRRVRWVPVLAAAAALVVGGGLAWSTLRPLSGADSGAAPAAESGEAQRSEGSAADGAASPRDDEEGAQQPGDEGSTTASSTATSSASSSGTAPAAGVLVLESGHDYTPGGLAREAGRQVSDASSAKTDPTASGPVQDCLADVRTASGGRPVMLDLARYDGAPAVVVVTDLDGRRQAWVYPRSCDGDPLAPPVTLRP